VDDDERGVSDDVHAFARMFEQAYLRFHRETSDAGAVGDVARPACRHISNTCSGLVSSTASGPESRRPQVRSRPPALSVGASSVIGDDQSPSGRAADGGSSRPHRPHGVRERPFQR
jgi:hypothetical protein